MVCLAFCPARQQHLSVVPSETRIRGAVAREKTQGHSRNGGGPETGGPSAPYGAPKPRPAAGATEQFWIGDASAALPGTTSF